MQRFIKALGYGFIAAAVMVVSVPPALAQKGGHGGGGFKGGMAAGGMGNSKSGSRIGQQGMGGTFKSGGGSGFKSQPVTRHQTGVNVQHGIKNVQQNLAKNGSMPFKQSSGGMHTNSSKGKFKDFYCGMPYGGKSWCNNWNGCYPNWNYGCYPYWGGYSWSRSYCGYPWYSYYPTSCYSTCYALSEPVCYTQTVYVPTVVQSLPVLAPPVEAVTTTNSISRTTTQAAPAAVPPGDMGFVTGSALNQ